MGRTLVIADVHGENSMLRAMLKEQGIIDDAGTRIDTDTQVIQLGDLGNQVWNSIDSDLHCYKDLDQGLIDIMLWGNHDMCHVVSPRSKFGGYYPPSDESIMILNRLEREGRVTWAMSVDDYLLTHAGVHTQWQDHLDDDPALAAEQINSYAVSFHNNHPMLSNVPYQRGGIGPGGVTWRDATEPLSDKWKQIFGHSVDDKIRKYNNDRSYCIDTGCKSYPRLAAIWLPEMKIVQVGKEVPVVSVN